MSGDLLNRTSSAIAEKDHKPRLQEEIAANSKHLKATRRAVKSLLDNSHLLLNHRRRFSELVGLLRDQLALHFALKESHGYLHAVVESVPRLSGAVTRLRHEHAELFEAIRRLADDSEVVPYQHLTLAELELLVERLAEFDSALEQHEENERTLIFEATDRDLGGEG